MSGRRHIVFQTSERERNQGENTQSHRVCGVASFSLHSYSLFSDWTGLSVTVPPNPPRMPQGRVRNIGGSQKVHLSTMVDSYRCKSLLPPQRLHGDYRPKFLCKVSKLLCLSKHRWQREDCTVESTCRQCPMGKGPPVFNYSLCLAPSSKYPRGRLRDFFYSHPKGVREYRAHWNTEAVSKAVKARSFRLRKV